MFFSKKCQSLCLLIVFYFISISVTQSQINQYVYNPNGKCNEYGGCTRIDGSVSCDVIFIKDKIYGCGGMWLDDINNASYLCRNGYHICSDINELINYGLTNDICATYPELNNFYATNITLNIYNDSCLINNNNNNYNIYGCALDNINNKYNTISNWIINNNNTNINCNILTAKINNKTNIKQYGWIISENNKLYKNKLGYGGVMCCRDADNKSTYEPEYNEALFFFIGSKTTMLISFIFAIIMFISLIKSIKKDPIFQKTKELNFRLMKYSLYGVFILTIVNSLVKILGSWLLILLNNKVFYDCTTWVIVLSALFMINRLVFYQFLAFRLRVSLLNTKFQYPRIVYTI